MEEIIKEELEINIRQIKRDLESIVPLAETSEDMIKMQFEGIKMLVDYCERLCLEGKPAMENWRTSSSVRKLKEEN